MSNWQTIFESTLQHQAEIVKSVLEDQGIGAVIVNRKDSSYNAFGTVQVKVEPDDVMRSLKLIKEDMKFD